MILLNTKPYRLAMLAYAHQHQLATEPGFLTYLHAPLGKAGRRFLLRLQRHMVATRQHPHVRVTGTLDQPTRLVLIPPVVLTLRDKIVANALWGVAHEPEIHYTQGAERMAAVHSPRMLPMSADCSSSITCWYSWAGAPDPNGFNYNGQGYTGTLLLHGKRITQAQAVPGDYVVFGWGRDGTGEHVSIMVEKAPDPWMVSHGQEAGPRRIPLSWDTRQPQRWIRSIPV